MKSHYIFLLAGLILLSCQSSKEQPERTARKYCSSCHVFPEPSLLDKKTWKESVLPEMAFRMGIDYSQIQNLHEDEVSEVLKVLPKQAMVTDKEWQLIQQYYAEHAPESLEQVNHEPLPELTQFTVTEHTLPDQFPQVTLIHYDSASSKLFTGTRSRKLYELDKNLGIKNTIELHSPPSAIVVKNDRIILTCMGIMDPNDRFAGRLIEIRNGDPWHHVLIDSLKRPVHFQVADLNNDGQNDYVIAAFGNYSGALLAYETAGENLIRHIVYTLPGTRKTVIKDFNGDGLNDILALITQGDEQLMLLVNQGKFKFRPQLLLRFSPVYGSSYFELADFNNDGHSDILYTNGDNADFSPLVKPYHGVRIFLNDGKNQFTENWFYQMPGASMAMARDYDKDGDPDIAAISFFPDFTNRPEHSFIYFENHDGEFTATATPVAASGRWLVMEAADIDNDNDDDILLGGMTFNLHAPPALFNTWMDKNNSLLLLRNTTK